MFENKIIIRALMNKEWQEQRWRFFLSTFVLSGLFASLLSARIIPPNEVSILIYGLVGPLTVIFLTTGPVATERAHGTWEFLSALPISRSDLLLTKWKTGLYQLIGMMTITTLIGVLTLWSRGSPNLAIQNPAHQRFLISSFYHSGNLMDPNFIPPNSLSQAYFQVIIQWAFGYPTILICLFACLSTIILSCCYTFFFFILTRARNEFSAALGGILLTIVMVIMMASWTRFLDPFLSLFLILDPEQIVWVPLLLLIHILLWVALPLWCVKRNPKGIIEKWMGEGA